MHAREGDRAPISINPNIVRQQAKQTVRHLIDAVVELVTNSDDSYRRLEESGTRTSGKITITVKRRKGSDWEFLEVVDEAEGMDIETLLKIVAYGDPLSGFEAGRSVRGMFGRGLKEAAIALGEAFVKSVKDGRESEVRLWWDGQSQKAMREVLKAGRLCSERNGTRVRIVSQGSEIKCPRFEKLYHQVANHYALRDINQSRHREIYLTVEETGGGRGRGARRDKRTRRVKYEPPPIRDVHATTANVRDLGKVSVKICEAGSQLDFNRYDPCSGAGLVVKTERASLDLELFGYENYDAGQYFFGEVYCPGITVKVRQGDYGLINTDRSGLNWKHPSCAELYDKVKELLRPHIEKKQKELAAGSKSEVPEQLRKKLDSVCSLLNRLARLELEDSSEEGENGINAPDEIRTLTIKPEFANGLPKNPRTFSVYLPKDLTNSSGRVSVVDVQLEETLGLVRLVSNRVTLGSHKKYSSLLVGRFQVVGEREGDKTYIRARAGSLEDIAEFQVQLPKEKTRPESLGGRRGGMFRKIEFDTDTELVPQRVRYVDGVVTVFLKFRPLSNYLGPGGKGIDELQGSLMLAELLAEAFCRVVARRKFDQGYRPAGPGGEVDA